MAGTILHFGRDTCSRIPVLKGAGYAVTDCRSVIQLRFILETGTSADAVALTGRFFEISEEDHPLSRFECPVPLILFEEKDEPRPKADFDLVVPIGASAVQWLDDVEDLIARSRAIRIRTARLRARSAILTRQAREAVELTQREFARSRQELAKDIPEILKNWGTVDTSANRSTGPAACAERDELDKSILYSLARLTQIIYRLTRASLDREKTPGPMEALKDEHHLECANLESLLTKWKEHKKWHMC